MPRGQPGSKGGRPKKSIDWNTVEKLCSIQCTGEEIASVIGVDYDTLQGAIKREHGMSFSDYFDLKRGSGKASLRRMQWEAAKQGNPTMLVWLGKQYLGQSDKVEATNTNRNYELRHVSDEQIDRILAEDEPE